VRDAGKLLVALGLGIALLGTLIWVAPSIPLLGRLPGDIRIERPGLRLYFPIATSLLLSVALTALFWAISRLR
jgi:hypothetical protein